MSSGLGGFLQSALEEQNVFERGLQELFLVVGELELEQAAGGVMEALGWGLQLAAQAIDQGTAGAGGVGSGSGAVRLRGVCVRPVRVAGLTGAWQR